MQLIQQNLPYRALAHKPVRLTNIQVDNVPKSLQSFGDNPSKNCK